MSGVFGQIPCPSPEYDKAVDELAQRIQDAVETYLEDYQSAALEQCTAYLQDR